MRKAFTLVEMMMVVVIIAILMGLTLAGVMSARTTVRNGIVVTQMSQLEMALENYRREVGEYPPDFTDARAVVRHIRKRWPRAVFDQATFDVVKPNPADPSTALAFWFNGPKGEGFCSDPANPFKDLKPKDKKYLEPGLISPQGTLAIYTKNPIVYFRSPYEDHYWGLAAPYWHSLTEFREPQKYQLIHPGLDDVYYDGPLDSSGKPLRRIAALGLGDDSPDQFRRNESIGCWFSDADYDNITNFSHATLEIEARKN